MLSVKAPHKKHIPKEIERIPPGQDNFFCIQGKLLSIIIFLVGLVSMTNLPIEQYPKVLPPQIVVSTNYPGASANTIAKTVAAPLEQQINGAKDMIYMNSLADDSGNLSINVYFEVGTDPDSAKIDVNNRVQAALSSMPEQVQRVGKGESDRGEDVESSNDGAREVDRAEQ